MNSKDKNPWYRNWTIHNLISHPVSEIFHLMGFEEFSNWIHDITVPIHQPGTGRG